LDANARSPEVARMPRLRPILSLAALLCFAVGGTAQDRIALPPGPGSLARMPGWTAIEGEALRAASRPTDPTDEVGHSFLLAILKALQNKQDGNQHVVLHSMGPRPGTFRLVNAYSTPGGTKSEVLQSSTELETAKKALGESLASPGVTVTFVASDTTALFAVGSLALHFELTGPNVHTFVDYYLVPAGDRVQFFETLRFADDVDARGEIESLLRTFDGAREDGADPILRGMLLGGAAGAAAGIFRAWIVSRRRRAQQAVGGSEAQPR
jgi:hypothetical protein